MAHALVSKVLKELGSIILEEAKKEVRVVFGTPQEIENFTCTLKSIQAVLIDAEEKQVKEETVKLWLENLKDVAYDMEDVLDEWSIEILRSEIEGVGVFEKVCSYLFSICNCNWNCFSQVSLRHGIGHKIKEIKGKLDVIAKEKDQFQLIDSGMRTTTAEPPTFRMTSSMIDVLDVCGRDHDKDIILSKVLSESSRQEISNVPTVISICGPGGIGKTTLAQMVYNDDKVKNHFEKRMWVCVSDPFDLIRLAKSIIEAAGEDVTNFIQWEALIQKLYTSVRGKRFLLVLDDVWTEKHADWIPLKLAFKAGAQGSRIVVTTRSTIVASMMGSAYTHDLDKLSEEECLVLFKRMAFHGWSKEECEKVKDIGVDIVRKCKGVPLFVKALGGLMFFKKTRSEWEQVLESDAWELQDVEKEVLPVLLLSYYALPSHVKRCFMYCAVFPKDYRIRKDELIKLWMAHGLLNSKGRRELAVVGAEYFNELLMRSFFQNMERDDNGNIIYYKMHDLIHDFAQFLTKTECFIADGNNTEFNNNSKKVRHLNITRFTDLSFIIPSIYEAKNLRTLIIDRRHSWLLEYVPALSDLFCQLTCLRELSLCIPNLEELPNEVEKCIHLRYFDLSSTRLKELPETMCRLYNLQTLKLNHCDSLCKLPQGIGKMIKLRHLEIKDTDELSYLPQGIGRLSSLRTLSKFIIGYVRGGGCKIGELKDLDHLEGDLEIFGLKRVADVNEANEAQLKNKRHIHGLKLIFECDGWGNMGEGEIKRIEGVLEGLQPHQNLEELQIKCYLGSKFPNWMDNSMLPKLFALEIVDCKKCVQFLAFGKFQFLQKLRIDRMSSVKHIGLEFLGINVDVDDDGTKRGGGESRVVVAFPELKELQLWGMAELEEWEMLIREEEEHAAGSGGRRDTIMPLLHTLELGDCPKLKELPHYIFPASLRRLFIGNCPKLTWTPCLPPLLEELTLGGDVGVLSRSLPTNQVNNSNNNLKSLSIYSSPHSSLPEGLAHLTSLQSMSILFCDPLMCMSEDLKQLTSLQYLEIEECYILGARCQKEVGEDWSIISHIPNIKINFMDVRRE